MYEFYINDQITKYCSNFPKDSLIHHIDAPEDRSRTTNADTLQYDDDLPKKPFAYGTRQNIINFFRRVMTNDKLD